MKRLLAFLFLIGVGISFLPNSQNKIFDNDNITSFCVVSQEELEIDNFSKVTKSGNQFYYYSDDKDVAQSITNYDGVILYFENYEFLNIVKDYNIQYFQSENVDEKEIYYGYTNLYSQCICVKNKRVNVQIAITENNIIVGFPAILTGF